MKNDANPIAEAKAYAREAIMQVHPDARETQEPARGSYEFDAIIIDDEACGLYEISIMHDTGSNTFALVEKSRAALELAREAERTLAIADLLGAVEMKVMMLAQTCSTEEELTAAWAAVSASASATMRERLHEVGGDVDTAMRNVERFLLTNPQ